MVTKSLLIRTSESGESAKVLALKVVSLFTLSRDGETGSFFQGFVFFRNDFAELLFFVLPEKW